jgi:hypothetical protein
MCVFLPSRTLCTAVVPVNLIVDVTTLSQPSSYIQKFEQEWPGLDKKMQPLAQHTKIEYWDVEGNPHLAEYKVNGCQQFGHNLDIADATRRGLES